MRIAFNRWPTLRDGRQYLQRVPTSDRDGPPRARVDRYEKRVQLERGEEIAAAYERLRRQLFDYEIFSPRVVGYRVVPAAPITDGSTIVQRIGERREGVGKDPSIGASRTAGARPYRGLDRRGAQSWQLSVELLRDAVTGGRHEARNLYPLSRSSMTSAASRCMLGSACE